MSQREAKSCFGICMAFVKLKNGLFNQKRKKNNVLCLFWLDGCTHSI